MENKIIRTLCTNISNGRFDWEKYCTPQTSEQYSNLCSTFSSKSKESLDEIEVNKTRQHPIRTAGGSLFIDITPYILIC